MTPEGDAFAPGTGSAGEVDIESVTSEGAGVGRLPDGRAVFVHRTVPGDRVRIALTRESGRWARARLVEVLEPGPDRREAPCPFYERCGGCTLEHLEYEAQLRAKGRIVADALARIGKVGEVPEPFLHPSPHQTRYRNRATFSLIRLGGGRVVAGFHELERPGRIFDMDGRCLLLEEALGSAWDALRAHWGSGARRLPAGRRLRLTLRVTGAGGALLLIEGGRGRGEPEKLIEEIPALHAVWKVRSRSRASQASPERLAGEARFMDRWMGEDVHVRPDAFLQVNREAADTLHGLVLSEVAAAPGHRVVDAYSGSGLYGRRLAGAGADVVGIESDPGAAAMAREGAPEGAQERFRLLEGRVEERLKEALPADIVILNPPRAGAADGVMERLAEAGPERVVYASCDPATLSRDVLRLGRGYRIAALHVVDLFPQTARVEVVVTLTAA